MSMLIAPSRFGVASPGDPLWDDVFSLLPMSGTDGSTTFTDQISGRVWTPTGDAEISTAESPFAGGSSGSFGTGYLTTGTLADWRFLHDGTTPWTIDIWMYVNALGATRPLFGNNGGSSANVGVGAWIDATGHARFFMTNGAGSNNINWTSSGVLFAAAGWYLVSLQWDPTGHGLLDYFIGGTQVASAGGLANAYAATNPGKALNIAALGSGAANTADGFRAQWRVTKALRYSDDFTPPTGPWPTHG